MFRTLAIKFYNFLFPVTASTPSTNSKDTVMRASIIELAGGRFGVATREGIIGSYARRRDAVRGATRRGLVVA